MTIMSFKHPAFPYMSYILTNHYELRHKSLCHQSKSIQANASQDLIHLTELDSNHLQSSKNYIDSLLTSKESQIGIFKSNQTIMPFSY
ncbi:hypothetical protein GmHk_07G018379 [Glycine max]|nr:hypothetical protein GmHk_07G018379 [Glycine max]